jgi:hypothetical protein
MTTVTNTIKTQAPTDIKEHNNTQLTEIDQKIKDMVPAKVMQASENDSDNWNLGTDCGIPLESFLALGRYLQEEARGEKALPQTAPSSTSTTRTTTPTIPPFALPESEETAKTADTPVESLSEVDSAIKSVFAKKND